MSTESSSSSSTEYSFAFLFVLFVFFSNKKVCDDVSELRDMLEKSDFAASVIIVGVGAADFTRFSNFPQFCVPSDLHKVKESATMFSFV
jgi:hypothetical protein